MGVFSLLLLLAFIFGFLLRNHIDWPIINVFATLGTTPMEAPVAK
jgi:hypothetical protein